MKYIKPELEIVELETNDIMTASGGEGSITVNGTTISGPKDDFSAFFGDLVG
jgi:hypothetical protein